MKKDVGAKTLLYPAPVLVVATYDAGGRPNAMTAAWGGICCSSPPCVTISLRKATYSYHNLVETKAFTLNIPTKDQAKEADYFGIASGRKEDKFGKTGLTPVKSALINAPYIEEFPINLECTIIHIQELGLHTQFIGEVLNVKMDEAYVENENKPAIERLMPLIYGVDSRNYYTIGDEIGKAYTIGKDI